MVAWIVYEPVGNAAVVLSSVQVTPSTSARPLVTTVVPSAARISTSTFSPAAKVPGKVPL